MPNRLINEQSLYLRQHAHNPVDWYPWGNEAFEKAQKENKPVIVSIGYAACHWCHVMERESFEDADTAAFMNGHFVNIKVDREEHPDVDQLYMDAVQAITGQGGWPLNVFVTPDKIPFYGGTYFPPKVFYNRPSWMQVLQRMNEVWREQPDEISRQKEQMHAFLNNLSDLRFSAAQQKWDKQSFDEIVSHLLKQADKEHGGFGNAPKFPQTMTIRFLLEHCHFTGYQASLQQAVLSLDKMMEGGIYDQLGGGFARYSTDAVWLAPHFEKMLYDNALLISVYATAYSITKQESYKNVVEETWAFIERELMDESGLFYSALDADSEGEEGKFYTWSWQEWAMILEDDASVLAAYFGITKEGNWEETNILHLSKNLANLAVEFAVNEDELKRKIATAKQKLFEYRKQRIRPATDDKCLLSWNALMNIALTDAYISLNDEKYLKLALNHVELMIRNFEKEHHLYRVWKNGEAKISATLEDYAAIIQALIKLASASSKNDYLVQAKRYCDTVVASFSQNNGVLFYYTSVDSINIPVRKIDVYDGALPSANALMANNLAVLGMCFGQYEWTERSYLMLQQIYSSASKHPLSFSYWALLMQRQAMGEKYLVLTGKESAETATQLHKENLFQCYILFSDKKTMEIPLFQDKNLSDETHIFVCTQEACLAPVTTVEEVLKRV